ncbi:lytic murein transglycosylase [Methyloraptor flagellatus]|uniref:Lytic murein transglycosylase n=1 Tax=Methyloraptor flagellatus TaxID=3162530 RepID=A0AAU7XD48_9HYPH
MAHGVRDLPPSRDAIAVLTRRGLLGVGVGGLASALIGGAPVLAQENTMPWEQWVTAFRAAALARGISAPTYDRVMRSIQPDVEVYKFDKAQPETQEPIWRYMNRRVNDWRIETGKARIRDFAPLFDRIERTYGVDRYMLCALWGMESAYGDVVVNMKWMRPVMPALAALAWGEARRRRYWETELLNALVIVNRGWSTPEEMIGSWAGAMGHTQWMPEVWLNMGVDFDGDGKVSPFGKPDDALAGTARYLMERGKFRRGETWGYEVGLPPGFDVGLADGRTWRSLGEWSAFGVRRITGDAFPRPADKARLWMPAGAKGPVIALVANFFAIRSYNPSNKYALAIGHLADRIRGGGPFVTPWPTDERQLSLAEVQEIQVKLTQAGYDTGGVDGRIGEKTQTAIQAWQRAVGMIPPDGFPSDAVLKRLRGG